MAKEKAKEKAMRWIAFRVAGIATALALVALGLVASPAAATPKTTMTVITAGGAAFTGSPITFTATVTNTQTASVPTGTVTFSITGTDSSTPMCDSGNIVTLTPGATSSTAQCTISAGLFADASPYAVTAMYTPTGNWMPSTGNLSKVIHKGATTTSLMSATNPTLTGEAVSFLATVSSNPPATGMPTGSVTFSITPATGPPVPCDAGDMQGLDSSDQATCSVADGLLAAGTPYTVSAVYSGDPNYATSTGMLTQTVNRATVTIGVTSSVSMPVSGQPIEFTASATVNPPGSGNPTGPMKFTIVGNDGTTPTCEGGDDQPITSGSATCDFPDGLPGAAIAYTVTATLSGDPNFKSPAPGTLYQLIHRATSEVSFPYPLPGPLVASQAFSFTAAIKTLAPGTGAPTGEYEWAVCPTAFMGVCTPQNGTKGGTAFLPNPTKRDRKRNMNEVTVSVPFGLKPGYYNVTVLYVGNPNIQNSADQVGTIHVEQVSTTSNIALSHNPIFQNGGKLRIRVGVIASSEATGSLGAPTGTVTYSITGALGDSVACSGGSNVITISTTAYNQGLAKCVIPKNTLMEDDSPYKIRVTYSGDNNYLTSTARTFLTVDANS